MSGDTTRRFPARVLRLVLVLLVVAAGYAMLKKHVTQTDDGRLVVSSDIVSYLEASSAMLKGTDIYHRAPGVRNSYVYPPFLAFCLIPATFVHPLVIDIFWYALNVALLGLILSQGYLLVTGRPLQSLSLRQKLIFAAVPTVLAVRYVVRNFQDANINLVLLALIMAGTVLAERRNNPRWAVLVGIAAAIKVLPALVLLYYAARRKWKEAAYMIAAAVGATVLPVLWLGPERLSSYLKFFLSYASEQFSVRGLPIENFSFWGLAGRLLTATPAFLSVQGEPVAVNFANLELETIRAGVTLFQVGVVAGLLLMLVRYSRLDREEPRYPRHGDLVLVILLMNLLSILIQDHHTVSFVLALQYLLVGALAFDRHRHLIIGMVVACGILSSLISYDVVVPVLGKDFYNRLLAWSLPVLPVGVTLASMTAWMMVRADRPPTVDPTSA